MNKKKNIELQDEVTVDEYKAWLTGLLRGKGNDLPDLNDWKAIKKMTDKIIPDVVEIPVTNPAPQPYPFTPAPVHPYWAPWWETQPTCGTAGQDGDNITINDGGSSGLGGLWYNTTDNTINLEDGFVPSYSGAPSSSFGGVVSTEGYYTTASNQPAPEVTKESLEDAMKVIKGISTDG